MDFQRSFTVNAQSTFLCYKYAAKQMVKQGRGGRIIGASSLAGKTGGAFMVLIIILTRALMSVTRNKAWPLLTAYSTSKFAVRGLTQNAGLLFF